MAYMNWILIYQLFTDPTYAATWAADRVGRPDIADDLIAICQRESLCTAIGAHPGDAHLGGWSGQEALGHLDESCQPDAPGEWATRGPWGLSAASHWAYLPKCYSPQYLDIVPVSALVAAEKYVCQCGPGDYHPDWCPTRKVKVGKWCTYKVPREARRNNVWGESLYLAQYAKRD